MRGVALISEELPLRLVLGHETCSCAGRVCEGAGAGAGAGAVQVQVQVQQKDNNQRIRVE